MTDTPTVDKTRWSTRYYRTDCPNYHDGAKYVWATHGPDDRADPGPGERIRCWLGHGEHPILRISPDEYESMGDDDEDD